jgi:hypothetical protein
MKKIRLSLLAWASFSVMASASAATIAENFASDPLQNGWKTFGDASLFQWNPTNQNLEVTWDSTRTNSYFYRPLGTIVTRNDDFSIAFDLNLQDIASGVEPGKTGPLQISFGFLNFAGATSPTFMRGSFGNAPNVAGFDYYTDGFYDYFGTIYPSPAATVPAFISGVNSYHYAPALVSTYNNLLPEQQIIHIEMTYTASNQTAVVSVSTNGGQLASLPPMVLNPVNNFEAADNFAVDTFSISSFSSVGDDYDSVLAHGTVANLVVTVPPPPVQGFSGSLTNNLWRGEFYSQSNWLYTLERSSDLQDWTGISPTTSGNGTNLVLFDLTPPDSNAFYRVRAYRP